MSSRYFAHRYWKTLTEADTLPCSSAAGRGRAGYTFWQRCWASFVGVDLPVRDGVDVKQAATSAPEQRKAPVKHGVGQPWTGWFPLPQLFEPFGLRAGDARRLVADVVSPDGRVEFFIRRSSRAPMGYRVEVVLRDHSEQPVMISIRYGKADSEQVILVPLTRQELGPPVSQVEVPDLHSGLVWAAAPPRLVDRSSAWDTDTVRISVRAAASETTRRAWRQVRDLVGDDMRSVIDRSLR
jgi:hypothetical protein